MQNQIDKAPPKRYNIETGQRRLRPWGRAALRGTDAFFVEKTPGCVQVFDGSAEAGSHIFYSDTGTPF